MLESLYQIAVIVLAFVGGLTSLFIVVVTVVVMLSKEKRPLDLNA